MWAVKVRLLKLNVFEPWVLIILFSAIPRLTEEFRSWRKTLFCKTAICTRKALRQIGININAQESLTNVSSPRPNGKKTDIVLHRYIGGVSVQLLLQRKSNKCYTYTRRLWYPACNARAPYCHPWSVRHYKIFPHYLIEGTILEKIITE